MIRDAGSRLFVLSDRMLVALWGMYSCERLNRFWATCDREEVVRFFEWAAHKEKIARLVETTHRDALIRQEEMAVLRSLRPRPRFVFDWDGHRMTNPRLHESALRPREDHFARRDALMNVHDLVRSVNRWCTENGIVPTTPGSKPAIDEGMVRYCCKNSLMDRPGSPEDGRSRGFSEKHVCQLRLIRLLQARSLPMSDINIILHGKPLAQLQEIERGELICLNGRAIEASDVPPQRNGSPSWA